jgi:hypothetical protein
MYKLQKDFRNEVIAIKRTLDNVSIPFDLANTDYQAYLTWLNQGNTPEPAEVINEQP